MQQQIDAINAFAFSTHDNALLAETISENPLYLDDHKSDLRQATFLAQIALNARTVAYREQKNYASFDIADYEHLRDLAKPLFELVESIDTDEPALMWASPWSLSARSAAQYALIMACFSFETDERLVELELLGDCFDRLKAIIVVARAEDPSITVDMIKNYLGYYEDDVVPGLDRLLD